MRRPIPGSLLLIALAVGGCGPERLDTSDGARMNASLARMSARMTDERKKQLWADVMAVTAQYQGDPLQGLTAEEIHAKAEVARREREAIEATLEKDRDGIAAKGIEAMREAAAKGFGADKAERAEITADRSGIEDLGARRWQVTGRYAGPDKSGRTFRAPWKAEVFIAFNKLQHSPVKLGPRRYSE